MAKVGPNAVIQLGEALSCAGECELARAIYAEAGCAEWWQQPPQEMVDESRVARLFDALAKVTTPDKAKALFEDAGRRTGHYILQNRIPLFARSLLPRLPSSVALRLLLTAISKHAWTFAGSGVFCYQIQAGEVELRIDRNPLATSIGCPWHRAVFHTLLNALLRRRYSVEETKFSNFAKSTSILVCHQSKLAV